MIRRTIAVLLAVSLCLVPTVALAKTNPTSPSLVTDHIVNLDAIPTPPDHSYDYTEPLDNPGPIETRVIFSEVYSTPQSVDLLLNDSVPNSRVIYGQRILETIVPGDRIYWGRWNGTYQAIKSTILYVAALHIETPVYSYLFSLFTGFSPQETSTVGIEIGYTYNTYLRETQIQATPGGAWETYYTAYRYDYFRYDRATVTNELGYNPPLYHHSSNPEPGAPPYRQGLSPNFNNYGELSTTGSLLYLNWCPAGWENETTVYYPLAYA